MTENELSKIILDLGINIHKVLGPGLLESAYEECLYYEINKYGLFVEKQKALPLIYENIKLEAGYRVDLWVEKKLIIYSISRSCSLRTLRKIFASLR
jgi:GxxExxY protein